MGTIAERLRALAEEGMSIHDPGRAELLAVAMEVERIAGRGRSLALAAHHALPGHDVDWRNVIELASALAPTEAK